MPGTAPGYTGPPLSPASGGYRGGLKAGVQHSSNNTVPLESTPTTTGLGNSSSGTAVGAGEGEAEEDECEDED